MKGQSVARGFAVLSAAGIIIKILSILYIPFLLAIIKDEGNGIYAAAYQVYVFIYVLTNSGIPVAISKLVSELIAVGNHKDAVKSFKIARFMLLIIGFTMSILMLVLASPLSKILRFDRSYLAILALAPSMLFTSVASSYRGYFQGRGNMTPTAVSQILEQAVNAIFTVVFAAALIKYGLEAACAGGTIGTSLGALLSALFLIVFHQKHDRYALPESAGNVRVKRYTYGQLVKKIINYSVPITFCVGMQYAGNLVDLWNTKSRLLVAGLTDKRATELYSHLSKYQQLLNVPIAITVALATAILPAISRAVALNDRKQVRNKISFAYKLCFLVTVPSAIGFTVLSTPIFDLLKYDQGAYLMKYGSAVLVLLAVVQIQTSILQGAGRLYTVTPNLVLGIIGKIAANFFLISIPQINIMGAIIGSIIGYCIPIALNVLVMKRDLKVRLHMKALIIKPLLASGFMGVAVFITYKILSMLMFFIPSAYAVNAVACIVSVFIGLIVYFVFLVLMKGISRTDLDVIPQKLLRFIPKAMLDRIKWS